MSKQMIAELAEAAGFSIAEECLQGVADTYATTMAMAKRVMATELPVQNLENAPVFDAWAEEAT